LLEYKSRLSPLDDKAVFEHVSHLFCVQFLFVWHYFEHNKRR